MSDGYESLGIVILIFFVTISVGMILYLLKHPPQIANPRDTLQTIRLSDLRRVGKQPTREELLYGTGIPTEIHEEKEGANNTPTQLEERLCEQSITIQMIDERALFGEMLRDIEQQQ